MMLSEVGFILLIFYGAAAFCWALYWYGEFDYPDHFTRGFSARMVLLCPLWLPISLVGGLVILSRTFRLLWREAWRRQ